MNPRNMIAPMIGFRGLITFLPKSRFFFLDGRFFLVVLIAVGEQEMVRGDYPALAIVVWKEFGEK